MNKTNKISIGIVISIVALISFIFFNQNQEVIKKKEPKLGAIEMTMVGKNTIEKANIKSDAISKLDFSGNYNDSKTNIEVEIRDGKVDKIDGGIELYARAWKGTKQLGLGSDGTTEWERFRFYNPPILVSDPAGSVVRTWTDEKTKETKTRTLKEDPVSAVKSTLAHTIKVSSKENTKIVLGSVGNTTDTFYPDSGDPGSNTVDGTMYASLSDALAQQWSQIKVSEANLNASNAPADYNFTGWGDNSSENNLFRNLMRSRFGFLTSTIGTDTISSAVLSLWGTGKTDPKSDSPNIDIYTTTPASDTALTASDYNQFGTTSQTGSPITYANWSTSAYNDFTFNATGIGNINKTGVSNFGTRNANFDVSGTVPTYTGTLEDTDFVGYFADQTGTDNDPKLVVVHAGAATGGGSFPRILNNE